MSEIRITTLEPFDVIVTDENVGDVVSMLELLAGSISAQGLGQAEDSEAVSEA